MRLSTMFFTALAATVAAAAGCESGPKVVPVSGTVLIDGQPLTRGSVQVMPTGYRAAAGTIGPDGRFTLTTTDDGDGCLTGTHAVRVVGNENVGPSDIRWLAPKKYASPDDSGLTVTITGPTKDLKIELTWAGEKPFIEKGSSGSEE
ncbi:hypothetical protein [Gemmata sp.]|uniref:hypothetical protein n=1 Tax=Gemmata sp. TaxID=1914242 RepID=UPI003F71C219